MDAPWPQTLAEAVLTLWRGGDKGSGVFFLTVAATGAVLSPYNEPKKTSVPLSSAVPLSSGVR